MIKDEADQTEASVTAESVDAKRLLGSRFGQYLQSIRNDRDMSLRDVEEATTKEVSNGYPSQIENDKIKEPSPHIVHAR